MEAALLMSISVVLIRDVWVKMSSSKEIIVALVYYISFFLVRQEIQWTSLRPLSSSVVYISHRFFFRIVLLRTTLKPL